MKRSIELDDRQWGAIIYALGTEIGWLRARGEDETPEYDAEIAFYKDLIFHINGTDGSGEE